MNIRVTIANEINSHAELATAKADEAIHHAKEAGKLLLEVKRSLAHGQFGAWLETNVKVSPRQAQRYMAAAEGKLVSVLAISSKSDTVSYLTNADSRAAQLASYYKPTNTEDRVAKLSVHFKPTWEPTPDHAIGLFLDEAAYWVTPSQKHPGFFYISKLNTEGGKRLITEMKEGREVSSQTLMKPLHALAVEDYLCRNGLEEPGKQIWFDIPIDEASKLWGDLSLPTDRPWWASSDEYF